MRIQLIRYLESLDPFCNKLVATARHYSPSLTIWGNPSPHHKRQSKHKQISFGSSNKLLGQTILLNMKVIVAKVDSVLAAQLYKDKLLGIQRSLLSFHIDIYYKVSFEQKARKLLYG